MRTKWHKRQKVVFQHYFETQTSVTNERRQAAKLKVFLKQFPKNQKI